MITGSLFSILTAAVMAVLLTACQGGEQSNNSAVSGNASSSTSTVSNITSSAIQSSVSPEVSAPESIPDVPWTDGGKILIAYFSAAATPIIPTTLTRRLPQALLSTTDVSELRNTFPE